MEFYNYISFLLNNSAVGIALSAKVGKDAINDDSKGENHAKMIDF